jgi:hypothetical protein
MDSFLFQKLTRALFSEIQLSASIFSIFFGADAVIRGEVVYDS